MTPRGRTSWCCWILPATHEGRGTMTEIVRRVAETVFIPFTVGGGIASVEDFTRLLRAGADKISVNSAAVRDGADSKASAKVRRPVCGMRY